MRLVAAALCLCALGACGERRSFDERYKDTGAELEARANAIDQNLANELPADKAASK